MQIFSTIILITLLSFVYILVLLLFFFTLCAIYMYVQYYYICTPFIAAFGDHLVGADIEITTTIFFIIDLPQLL